MQKEHAKHANTFSNQGSDVIPVVLTGPVVTTIHHDISKIGKGPFAITLSDPQLNVASHLCDNGNLNPFWNAAGWKKSKQTTHANPNQSNKQHAMSLHVFSTYCHAIHPAIFFHEYNSMNQIWFHYLRFQSLQYNNNIQVSHNKAGKQIHGNKIMQAKSCNHKTCNNDSKHTNHASKIMQSQNMQQWFQAHKSCKQNHAITKHATMIPSTQIMQAKSWKAKPCKIMQKWSWKQKHGIKVLESKSCKPNYANMIMELQSCKGNHAKTMLSKISSKLIMQQDWCTNFR